MSIHDVECALGVNKHTIDVERQDVGSDVEGAQHMNVVSAGYCVGGDGGDGLSDLSAVPDGQNQLVIDQNQRSTSAVSTGAPDGLCSDVVIRSDKSFHGEGRGAEVAAVEMVSGTCLVGVSQKTTASGP